MKRLARLAVPSVILGFAALPLLACFSSDSSGPGVTTPLPQDDSGLPADEDATLPGVVVDSGSSDAGVDAAATVADADAAPGPLTVKVLRGGAPEPGILVVFQDATGAVVSTATTDVTGTVSQLVVAGSQLTAVLGSTQNPDLVTVQDVENADALTLLDLPLANPSSDVPNVAVTLPAATWDASSAFVYMNAGPCGDPQGFDLYISPNCASQGAFPVFARAYDGTGELGYTYQTGNPVASDGGPLAVTVGRPWSMSSVTETIAASSFPAGADASSTNVAFHYTEVAGGVPLSLPSLDSTSPDGGLPSQAFVVHTGYPDYTQDDAVLGVSTPPSLAEVFAVTRSAPATASRTTSLALGTLPAFTSAAVNAAGDAGTTAQPLVSWTTTGSLSAANGLLAMLQWYSPEPDGGSGSIHGTWTLVAPSAAASVQAPSLPASASAFTPAANAAFTPPRVVAVSAPFIGGYSAFKSQFATVPVFTPGGNWQPSIPALPANGLTLYVSVIYPDEG